MSAPLTDGHLDEIVARAADVGCPDCGVRDAELRQLGDVDVPELIAEVRRLRGENEQLADLDTAASRRAELQAERDRAVQRWHDEHKRAGKAEAALADAAGYLAATHRHANRHDVLGAGLNCAGCALLARIEGAQAETRHFSPSYPGEIPDHLGRADACPMPACAASRGPAARTADTEENR